MYVIQIFFKILMSDLWLMTSHNKLKQRKTFEKYISRESIPVEKHPTRWLNGCMPEDEERVIELIFPDKT